MSKKQSRKEQAEMNARVRSNTCKMWFETSRTTGVSGLTVTFGLVEVPVEYLSHPAGDIADRKRNAPHVKVIEKSMTVHGIMKTDVVVLIWLEDILAAGLDPKNIVFAPLNLINNKPPVPMYVIAGDHTALAAKNICTSGTPAINNSRPYLFLCWCLQETTRRRLWRNFMVV